VNKYKEMMQPADARLLVAVGPRDLGLETGPIGSRYLVSVEEGSLQNDSWWFNKLSIIRTPMQCNPSQQSEWPPNAKLLNSSAFLVEGLLVLLVQVV